MNLTLREVFDRYGPTLAVIAVLALLVVLMPGNGDDDAGVGVTSGAAGTNPVGDGNVVSGSDDGGLANDIGGGSSSGATGTRGPQAAQAPVAPPAGQTAWRAEHGPGNFPPPTPDTACREDGALPGLHPGGPAGGVRGAGPATPACVPVFDGDNGGATALGVTATEILIVRYSVRSDPATQATLRAIGASDPPEAQTRSFGALFRYYATHFETYGREPKIVDYVAQDGGETTSRANAVEIATEIKPFLVFNAPVPAAEELAARGIICVCAFNSHAWSFYREWSPYIWGVMPPLEEYYQQLAEYMGKRLAGKPAKWAGTNLRVSNDMRAFGLIYVEGSNGEVDPRTKQAKNFFDGELAKYGIKLARSVAYTVDIQQQQQQATNIIGQMVDAGVNNVICVCDALYPIFLTSEATRQSYFPEWLITGTNLLDTTFFGRTYDKEQWSHAFGISPLAVLYSDVTTSSGYRAYHHMNPDGQRGDEGVGINAYQGAMQFLVTGLHHAGPRLTVETFAQGMYSTPPSGGDFKSVTFHFTPESPAAFKDFTEVWWNETGSGKDEIGNDGAGILQKANGGVRYELGEWPQADPYAFSDDPNPVFTSDDPPEWREHGVPGHTHTMDEPCRSCPGGNPPGSHY